MKQRVLVDVRVVCDPPRAAGHWMGTLEQEAKRLEDWCRDFEAFLRDHKAQDRVSVGTERVYQDRCSHCGHEWEEDADGPLCCDEAQAEWEGQRKNGAA